MAKSVAAIRKRFSKLKTAIKEDAERAGQVVSERTAPQQAALDKNGWNGDTFDLAGLAKVFERSEHDQDVTKAVTNSAEPGGVGDLAVSTLQGDFLAAYERAFRLLHASPVRLAMHAAARHYGHGHDAGVFTRGLDSYLNGLLKIAKRA